MNETIGSKGGHNDRRRSLIISRKKKEKLKEEQEIKELEKSVKKNRKYVLIKTVPLVLAEGIIQFVSPSTNLKNKTDEYGDEDFVFTDDSSKKSSNTTSKKSRKKIISINGENVVVSIPPNKNNKKKVHDEIELLEEEEDKEDKKELKNKKDTKNEKDKNSFNPAPILIPISIGEKIFNNSSSKSVDKTHSSDEMKIIDNILSSSIELEKVKSRKIVEAYEKELKDIRYDLRLLIYEYNHLVDDEEKLLFSDEAADLLDKLTSVISKLEELEKKIQIDDLDKYDDDYIYYLIEEYMKEFKSQKIVDELKDSPLYIEIVEKIEELQQKKDILSGQVEEKKTNFEEREKKFDELKEKFNKIEQINKELLDFQYEQDALLQEAREKVRDALTVEEKVKVEMKILDNQSRRLLRMIALRMFFPGSFSAKAISSSIAAYLLFTRRLIQPETITKKYKVIKVIDYGEDIKDSISSLEGAIDLLGKTGKQVDRLIDDIHDKFKDYIGVVKECDYLLYDLNKIKDNIKEKEYEMERIKKEQENVLKENNAKVLKIGEYPIENV